MTTLNKEHSELDHILVSLDSNPAIKKQVKANIEKLIQTSNKEARLRELLNIMNIKGTTVDAWASPAHQRISDRIEELTKQEEAK